MSNLDGWTIGFIGLGLMGKPMCRNLQKAGAHVIVHNRSRASVDELAAEGMEPADGPADVAAKADIVILMLTNTPAVEAVLLGSGGVIENVGPGSLIVDMGTTKVLSTRDYAEKVRAKGGDYVDAPVSGGAVGAEAGNLTIMAGGSDEALARIQPVFDVLGAKTTHIGAVGAGQVAKAANQVIVGLTIGAVAEALTLARKAGADPALVRQALRGGFADSRILELHGQRMIDGAFEAGGRANVQRKDLDQALELAGTLDLDLPATSLSRDLFDKLIEAGHGDLDHSALIKAIDPEA